jgi:hypothetical protein
MEARDRMINEAQGDTIRRRRSAQSEALGIERAARASGIELVLGAEGSQAAFLAMLAVRNQPEVWARINLLLAAFRMTLQTGSAQKGFAWYQQERLRTLRSQIDLTDFRLYWNTLSQALTGRDKVLIDSDKVPGRRHMLLFDPEPFRSSVLLPATTDRPRGRGDKSGEGP